MCLHRFSFFEGRFSDTYSLKFYYESVSLHDSRTGIDQSELRLVVSRVGGVHSTGWEHEGRFSDTCSPKFHYEVSAAPSSTRGSVGAGMLHQAVPGNRA